MSKKFVWSRLAAAGVAVLIGSCTGSGTAPSPGNTTGSGTITATITISNNAVSPRSVTVAQGAQVTIVNNDSRLHLMFSDPHPDHTDCPEINQVGFLSPGQTRLTGNLNTVRTCGFHDHDQPTATSLQGSITITGR